MKKHILPLVSSFLILSCLFNEKNSKITVNRSINNSYPGPCAVIFDEDNDGVIDRRSTYTYDSNGNELSEAFGIADDGTMVFRSTYTYDQHGNKLTYERDYKDDGKVEDTFIYTYDTNGNKLTEAFYYSTTVKNLNSLEKGITTWFYDANGNIETWEYDEDIDGIVTTRSVFKYNSKGNKQTEEIDFFYDGTVETRYIRIHNSKGNILRTEFQKYYKEKLIDTQYISYTYDTSGETIISQYESTMDITINYSYDNYGNKLS